MNKIWIGIGTLVAALASVPVVAQVAQDFPNLKGPTLPIGGPFTLSRTGRNGDPAGSTPGPGNLRWFTPNGATMRVGGSWIDNTDVDPVATASDTFPLPDNAAGYSIFDAADWASPTLDQAANDAFEPLIRPQPDTVNGYPRNSSPRTPGYVYTRATNSASNASPTSAANPASLRTFTWRFEPTMGPGRYALSVHIPILPTTGIANQAGDNDPLGRVFPQRYNVYRVTSGSQTKTVILDTYANTGWVPLAPDGSARDSVVEFDGTNPVTITLFNTVPRNSNEQVLLPPGATQGQTANNFLVYADAAMATPAPGSYSATPTSARLIDGDINSTVVTAANNVTDVSTNTDSGETSTFTNAVVSNYNYQNGDVRWTFSPVTNTTATVVQDDSTSVLAGSWIQDATVPHLVGTSPSLSLASTTGVADAAANYSFDVPEDGSYAVYAYIPPDPGATYPLARAAFYEIETFTQSAGIQTQTIAVNQDTAAGWVRLGGRFYHSRDVSDDSDIPVPLRVRVLNYSSDAGDAGARYVYADAIRVIGEAGVGVTSSPVHATALVSHARGAAPIETKVVFIADESGRIHCLDANGNGDGTTREYWCYPSYRDTEGYDPNLGPVTGNSNTVYGEDWSGPGNTPVDERNATAVMPSGFDLSTATVHRLNVGTPATPIYRDRLFIGASNGRVYAIDVTGRGDGDGSVDPVSNGTRTIGTTTRAWTYPATYPANSPVTTSSLGTFRGSLAFFDTNGSAEGGETIYAPASQGRIYALDANGDVDQKQTTLRWAYPSLTQPTLGSIQNTPSVEFGNLYFGTNAKLDDPTDQFPGAVYALNATTGDLAWTSPFYRTDTTTTDPTLVRTDNFQSGLVTIPGTFLTSGIDTVCALNENRVFYWLNAATGEILNATNELQGGSVANLGFAMMNPYDVTGTISATPVPMVLVPLSDGRLRAIRANGDVELDGSHVGWGRDARIGGMTASMANSNGWLYAADTAGYLRAYNAGTGLLVPGESPDIEVITGNNPLGNRFRKAKVSLITGDTFRALRRPEGDPLRANYTQALGGRITTDVSEWGQTLYLMVYDFPYEVQNSNGDFVDPPSVNITFSFDGKNSRNQSVVARTFDYHVGASDESLDGTVPRFETVAPSGPLPDVTDNPRMNGFAIVPFPITSSGQNSLPPGRGEAVVQINTASLNTSGALQSVGLPPNTWYSGIESANVAWSRYPITVANPLAIVVPPSSTTNPVFTGSTDFSLGLVTDPGSAAANLRQEALQNGSLDIAGTTKRENLLGTNTALTGHGSTGRARLWVIDRSYMSLLRPGGLFGLDNVRMDRRDMAWQGGASSIVKRFDSNFGNFEDLPVNYPNNSLDYPDLRRERVKATKDPNGSAENPMFSNIALYAPRTLSGGVLTDSTPASERVFRPTPFEISVDVPKYQPANFLGNLQAQAPGAIVGNSSASGLLDQQGYIARLNVFVDTTTNGSLDLGQREAFRSFNFATGVGIDERLRITTPIVDFGSLASGTGVSPTEAIPGKTFDPTAALSGQTTFLHPWGGVYQSLFKPFGIVNDGNVNMLDVRLAKRSDVESGAGNVLPLTISPDENEGSAWLNGLLNLHSDIDFQFSPGPLPRRPVILQKPRVNDRVPTELRANPVRRVNSNLGTTGTVGSFPDVANASLEGGQLKFPAQRPRVAVSVPIGFPVGKYSAQVIAFENLEGSASPFDFWTRRGVGSFLPSGLQPYTNPGFTINFNVVESRLTNTYTPFTAPQVDNLVPFSTSAQNTEKLYYQNTQPAAARDSGGNLVMAFVSNRPSFGAAPAADAARNTRQIYLTSLNGSYTAIPTGLFYSPLGDLSAWSPATNWWRQGPTIDLNPLTDPVPGTVVVDNPAFPSSGFVDPLSGNTYATIPLAYTVKGSRYAGNGTIEESRLAVTWVSMNAAGEISLANTRVMNNDLQVSKSEPSVFAGNGSTTPLVFYTGTSAGRTWGYYSRVGNDGFGPSSPLPFGDGFLSVSGIGTTGRYRNRNTSAPIVEMSFSGHLKGRPNAEVFLAQAGLVDGHLAENTDGTVADTAFLNLPERTADVLSREAAGIYRARGVEWDRSQAIDILQSVGGGAPTSILVANTRQADRETGIISFETRLGGRVAIDTHQGLIRFSSAVPTGSSTILATYTPKFLRLSDAASVVAGSSKTTLLFDSRPSSNFTYWRTGTGNFTTSPNLLQDRLIGLWNRSAGGGVTARPFLKTQRLGVPLGRTLPTLPDGSIGFLDGNTVRQPVSQVLYLTPGGWVPVSFFEMDPAQGNIYLPAEYEGAAIQVVFHPRFLTDSLFQTCRYITERTQEPVRIETAVNESNLTGFLDPAITLDGTLRPPLVWLFWSSTRGGVSDIYFESIAPIWRAVPVSK